MFEDIDREVSDAVQYYYQTLRGQAAEHEESETEVKGRRSEVLGGQQMDGFAWLIEELLVEQTSINADYIKHDYQATLPGYYRPEKEWDTAVVYDDQLYAALEYKSQGSSIGNNLNNRTEEAIGSNTDIQKAYEEGLFEPSPAPWVGYLILMVDNKASQKPRQLRQPNFPADDEFQGASYVDRMELLCLRMLRQRLVDGAGFLLSNEEIGIDGEYREPNEELAFERFARSLISHVNGHLPEDARASSHE
ncbi:PaeR7I family type II restriction endonuclease (plasmid) [Halobacterium sp. NMX12-1]|uniref:PaeR7I family type II restriction endonuclease n=1 Tax=Halobacterium sp. NMX12-1 TaxID=3166650 RepID=A0AAU8CGT8_9EURY